VAWSLTCWRTWGEVATKHVEKKKRFLTYFV